MRSATDKEHKRQLDIWMCGHFQNPAFQYAKVSSHMIQTVGWSVGRLICVCSNTRNHTSLSQSTFNKWICVYARTSTPHVHVHTNGERIFYNTISVSWFSSCAYVAVCCFFSSCSQLNKNLVAFEILHSINICKRDSTTFNQRILFSMKMKFSLFGTWCDSDHFYFWDLRSISGIYICKWWWWWSMFSNSVSIRSYPNRCTV